MVKYASLKQVLNNPHIINKTLDIRVFIINLIFVEKHYITSLEAKYIIMHHKNIIKVIGIHLNILKEHNQKVKKF